MNSSGNARFKATSATCDRLRSLTEAGFIPCSGAVLRTALTYSQMFGFEDLKWWVACDGHNLRSIPRRFAAYAAGHRRGSLPSPSFLTQFVFNKQKFEKLKPLPSSTSLNIPMTDSLVLCMAGFDYKPLSQGYLSSYSIICRFQRVQDLSYKML